MLFSLDSHGLSSGKKVVFTIPSVASTSGYTSLEPSPNVEVPRGLGLNTVYFVISSGLTTNSFYVAATSGGTSIPVTGTASGVFYVAEPVTLSGYTIDSDIKGLTDDVFVATFASNLTDSDNGAFELSIAPSVSSGIEAGRYGYDISLTQPTGDRYYWLTGVATIQSTYSRN